MIVIGPYMRVRRGEAEAQTHDSVRDFEGRIEEAAGLARAIDLTVIESIVAPVSQIRPATYLGKGSGQAGDRERLHQRAPTGSNIPIRRTTRRRDKKMAADRAQNLQDTFVRNAAGAAKK